MTCICSHFGRGKESHKSLIFPRKSPFVVATYVFWSSVCAQLLENIAFLHYHFTHLKITWFNRLYILKTFSMINLYSILEHEFKSVSPFKTWLLKPAFVGSHSHSSFFAAEKTKEDLKTRVLQPKHLHLC